MDTINAKKFSLFMDQIAFGVTLIVNGGYNGLSRRNLADRTLSIIKNTINQFDFNKSELTKDHFSSVLAKSHFPKYIRWKDWVNGMGITIHDINSTKIPIERLTFQGNKYTAVVKYKAQDHFGLDKEDILKAKFNAIGFFRIWLVLHFSQKPFFTNFEATITLTGENNV